VEVTGSNPVAPTIVIFLPHSHLRVADFFWDKEERPGGKELVFVRATEYIVS
jgi:hypothetical protein